MTWRGGVRNAMAFYAGSGGGSVLARAVTGSAGLRAFGMALTFLVGVQLARGLGPTGYGQYSIAMAAFAILMTPTEFGVPQLVTREVAIAHATGDWGLIGRLLRWTVSAVLTAAAVTAGATVLVVEAGPFAVGRDLASALFWAAVLLPTVALGNVWSAALRGLHHLVEGQVGEIVIRPGLFSLLIAAVSFGLWRGHRLDAGCAMALNVVASAVAAAYAAWRLVPRITAVKSASHPASSPFGSWVRSALTLALGEGMRVVAGNLAVIIVGAFASEHEAGLYRIALGVYAMTVLPSTLLNVSCSPILARLYGQGRLDAIQRLNGWFVLILAGCAILALLPFAFAGGTILALVFGQAYRDAAPILLILLGGEFVCALLGHPVIVLNALRRERAVTLSSALALAVNTLLCLGLARGFGAVGVAIGVAVGQIVWRAVSAHYALKRLHLDTTIRALPTLVAQLRR